MVRRVVLPVPIPMMVRPGARELIVAMPQADKGAMRDFGLMTPGPSLIVLVRSAHSASAA